MHRKGSRAVAAGLVLHENIDRVVQGAFSDLLIQRPGRGNLKSLVEESGHRYPGILLGDDNTRIVRLPCFGYLSPMGPQVAPRGVCVREYPHGAHRGGRTVPDIKYGSGRPA